MLNESDDWMPSLPRRHTDAENNVLPLINVVFLLLIFFMVSGTLIQEPPFELTPPSTRHAEGRDARPEYLAIGADGRLAWGGEPIEKTALAAQLEQRQNVEAALQVRADRRVTARELNELLASLRAGGVSRIQLLTENR